MGLGKTLVVLALILANPQVCCLSVEVSSVVNLICMFINCRQKATCKTMNSSIQLKASYSGIYYCALSKLRQVLLPKIDRRLH